MDAPHQIFTIVIADDDLDDHLIIKEAFSDVTNNIVIHSVFNGLELINWFKTHPLPNLVLMDLNMPLLNGMGALLQLKSNQALKHIPVYMLSTSRFGYDRQKAKELGAEEFYNKPFSYNELRAIIRDIYELHLVR